MKNKLLFIVIIGVIILVIARSLEFSLAPSTAPEEHNSNGSRLFQLLSGGHVEGYSQAIEARSFQFPEDHGPHQGFRNEWWYLTGNLDSEQAIRFRTHVLSLRPETRPPATRLQLAE